MTAATACRTCGTEPREGARFCDACGSLIAPATEHAEYKQVTVLFADVVGSMDIAATVGAERLREIMASLADRCAAVVQHFGGTVDKFTGDGIMAVFGAPVALEDHAVRACLAALRVQQEAKRLAVDVRERDAVDLRLRVGLNSGQVIAGEIGSGPFGYTAVGEQVGMAQRMESVAPPDGVLLSASTARLVDGAATIGESELVQIKGAAEPVTVHRLLGVAEHDRAAKRAESDLVGRRWEMSAVAGLLERAIDGQGAVVGVVGPPGIGKSRLVREVGSMAGRCGVEVFKSFCESHTSQVPFHAVAHLLRAVTGIDGLDAQAARDRVRAQVPDADPEDLVLFDDLLGIADPAVPLPTIDPDARRRRLTALVNTAWVARETSAVYVVEDAHWIDEVSESMIAEFLTVTPKTPSLVLVTYRPEYRGLFTRVRGAQSIALAPLSDPESAALIAELLGPDPSIGGLSETIAARAAGNPFFVEEIVRELADRHVLRGEPGAYTSTAQGAEVRVPATLQATIAARIDRLDPKAKRALSTAAVVGSRFKLDLLTAVGVEPAIADLVAAQLIDQVRFTPEPEYVFHHPLIRAVAYETQLKSDRAELHRRVSTAIEQQSPESVDENAALIAEHLEAAGEFQAAYAWHMRAGTWLATRNIDAARRSWEHARHIADGLPTDGPGRTAMRIAPRTMLCGSAWQGRADISDCFQELRELCTTAGDRPSLAIGMTGLVAEHLFHARVRQASRLASDYMALLESIGDPTLTIGLSVVAIFTKLETGEMADALRWAQTVVDVAAGDPTAGSVIMGCPLAVTLALRGLARCFLGDPRSREDLHQAVDMARATDPLSHVLVVAYKYGAMIPAGVLLADETALREIDEALHIAERSSDDDTLGNARLTLGLALVHRGTAERDRGLQLLRQVRDMCRQHRYSGLESPLIEVYAARERARRGDPDDALPLMRAAIDDLFDRGQAPWCAPCTDVLVQTLLTRGDEADIAEAEVALDRLAAAPLGDGFIIREIMLLRLRALLARAHGDEAAYLDYRDRYRAMAKSLGFEGHMKWAEAMA
jgi:class 3 adenylate cyclase